ncbi:MAG: glycosyltransferase [Chloroflexi bacterium]|nr:glycosyltransferase [Chloroflexota bacterium]
MTDAAAPHVVRPTTADVTVVVPARNAERLLPGCLMSVNRQGAGSVIVVDGVSTDSTVEVAERLGARVISDEGRGLPHARAAGAAAAATRYVALVDADVILPDGSLAALLEEFTTEGYVALQAGLESEAGPGYWGQALAWHHRTGRSRYWFGLVATIIERDRLLEHGFDAEFESGEDIELRWRLAKAGEKAGVSRKVIVRHRFDDTWEFAQGQFRADGRGLARMVRKHGLGGARLLLLPGAAAVRGIGLCLVRGESRFIAYYLAFAAGNYAAMAGELFRRRSR